MVEFGTLNPDGSIQTWPTVDINGNGYTYPPTTVRISADKFVVIPANPAQVVWEQIEALKANPTAPVRTMPEQAEPVATFTPLRRPADKGSE